MRNKSKRPMPRPMPQSVPNVPVRPESPRALHPAPEPVRHELARRDDPYADGFLSW